MTIRQLWVRTRAILDDPESPLCRAIERARLEAEEDQQIAGMDAALNLVTRGR